MKNNILQDKTYAFAVRVVRAYQYLYKEKNEFVLSRQFLKSGTSIGANTEEAIGAQSSKDFLSKLQIVYKEARETHYWIRLLHATDFFEDHIALSLLSDCDEILKITGSIINTLKQQE